jgi:predicted nucleic acid-binding Zn ribbon protein
MSDIVDKLKEGAGHVISEVDKGGQIQAAISGLRQRMAEADRKRKVSLVKQRLQELQSQEAQAINALSAQVLALHEAKTLTQPELVSLCKRVDDIRVQIQEQEAELKQLLPAQPELKPEGHCPNCGSAIIAGGVFCQTCGTRLAEQPKPAPIHFCIQCGAQLREGARFCPQCGQTVPQS